MNSLYHAELIEHYKSSPYRRVIVNPTVQFGDLNPSCGDKLDVAVVLDGETIVEVAFQGSGCVISQAGMSMICEQVENKSIEKVLNLNADDVLSLINIDLGPVRMKCATLGLHVVQQAIKTWQKESMKK